jgi:hypothetical protein
MKYYIEYKDREEFDTLCKHYKEIWGYVAPSTCDIPPGFIIENDVLDWKNSTLNPPTDAKKITFQEWKEMVHLENKLNPKLEWKKRAYVRYLGTKQGQKSGEDWEKCWVIINEKGVSTLTPEQYADAKFNALVESNLRKWDRNTMNKKDIPETLISKIYDENDNVLFGSCYTKGKVSFHYLDGKYSTDGKHIFICSSVLYDGEGNSTLPKDAIIMSFNNIKKHIE